MNIRGRSAMSGSWFSRVVAHRHLSVVAASACTLGLAGPAALAPPARAAATPPACSLATLRGTYLYAGNGSDVSGATVTPTAFAGSEVYSGTGRVSGSSTDSTGGKIRPRSAYTGTYTLNENCTGTLTVGTTLTFDIYVAPSGDRFTYVQTNAGSVSAVTEARVAAA
jgi:hypothetical protein